MFPLYDSTVYVFVCVCRSETYAFVRLLSGIAGSSPAGYMDVCLL